MSTIKTVVTNASVSDYISAIPDETKRRDSEVLLADYVADMRHKYA